MSDLTKFSPVRDGVRSEIPLNKMHTTTGNFFRIDAVHMLPCVQKDIISLNIHSFIDSAPNPYPINGSMKYGQYAFFVPYRILWDKWPDYIYHLQDLTQPYFTLADLWNCFHSEDNPWIQEGYFDEGLKYISNIRNLGAVAPFLRESDLNNIPPKFQSRRFNGYALRAMNRIWWDWFRDKAHISDAAQESYVQNTGGHMTVAELIQLCAPKYRCYPKNYITTAFEAPQEGAASFAAVSLPSLDLNPGLSNPLEDRVIGVNAGLTKVGKVEAQSQYPQGTPQNSSTNIIGQFDMNQLKLKTSAQNLAERLMFAGKTRLSRALALFDTSPTIEELQMSLPLGGHEEDLLFDTMSSPGTTAFTADRAGSTTYGVNPYNGSIAGQKFQNIVSPQEGFNLKDITYKTDETGFLVVVGCVMPLVQYYQGLPRDWFLGTDTLDKAVTDYYHSDYDNQPLQPVLNAEVCFSKYCNPTGVFGFNQNYIQYKMEMDTVGGEFVTQNSVNAYKQMFLGRDIESELLEQMEGDHFDDILTPAVLTQTDYTDENLMNRFFTMANHDEDHFRINHKIEVMANRPMSGHVLSSIDSALSQSARKKLVETGGFRY